MSKIGKTNPHRPGTPQYQRWSDEHLAELEELCSELRSSLVTKRNFEATQQARRDAILERFVRGRDELIPMGYAPGSTGKTAGELRGVRAPQPIAPRPVAPSYVADAFADPDVGANTGIRATYDR